jgi:hypothetical protein
VNCLVGEPAVGEQGVVELSVGEPTRTQPIVLEAKRENNEIVFSHLLQIDNNLVFSFILKI